MTPVKNSGSNVAMADDFGLSYRQIAVGNGQTSRFNTKMNNREFLKHQANLSQNIQNQVEGLFAFTDTQQKNRQDNGHDNNDVKNNVNDQVDDQEHHTHDAANQLKQSRYQANTLKRQESQRSEYTERSGQHAFGFQGLETLNVQKITLNKPEPNKLEEKKTQYEAFLRQTVRQQIEQLKKKKEKTNTNELSRTHSKEHFRTTRPRHSNNMNNHTGRSIFNKWNKLDAKDQRSDHQSSNMKTLRRDESKSKRSQARGARKDEAGSGEEDDGSEDDYDEELDEQDRIHLVSIDGPRPGQPIARNTASTYSKDLEAGDTNANLNNDGPRRRQYFPPKKLPNPIEALQLQQEMRLQARKDAVAHYSEISRNRYKQDETMPLKYVIRPENNAQLVHRVFEESGRCELRDCGTFFPGWEPADDQLDSLFNFKWKPCSNGINFDFIGKHGLKQLVNHVRGHQELTTKDRLFFNMKDFFEQ